MPPSLTKKEILFKAFRQIWSDLFTSPVHLDSALSKQSPSVKSILAQILPTILLKPGSLAEHLGVGVAPEEPWNLSPDQLAKWKPAFSMCERLYELMPQGIPKVEAGLADYPPQMIEEWNNLGGDHNLYQILAKEPPLSLRVSRKFGVDEVFRELTEKSNFPVKVEISDLSPLGVRLSGYAPVLKTPLFEKGAYQIQDEGSQLMTLFALWPQIYGKILQTHPGQTSPIKVPALPESTPVLNVVDACAGAGGKSLAFADILKGKGRIFAYDISEKKLQALRRRATHSGFNNIQTVALKEGNESSLIQGFHKTADVVLVDSPCSGWGVLRRNPDIKWRQSSDTLAKFPEIQFRLLSQYSVLVKPGGRLVFGVCTFRKSETRDVVERFLSHHSEFKALEGGFLGPGPCDGFFMQAFSRIS